MGQTAGRKSRAIELKFCRRVPLRPLTEPIEIGQDRAIFGPRPGPHLRVQVFGKIVISRERCIGAGFSFYRCMGETWGHSRYTGSFFAEGVV